MKGNYLFVATLIDPGVVHLEHYRHGLQLWRIGKMRKSHRCAECGDEIAKEEEAFLPVTNSGNRWHRLHVKCVDRLRKVVA